MKPVTKSLAMLLVLSLLCASMSVGLTASAEEAPAQSPAAGETIDISIAKETYELPVHMSPMFEGMPDADGITFPAPSFPSGEAEVLSEATYLTADEAVEQIRANLAERVENITLRVQSASPDCNAVIADIFDRAMAHNGNGKEGDSLRWQCAWGGKVWLDKISDGVYCYTCQLTVVPFSNAAQEAELDTAVSNVLSQLALDGKSDYEKVCAVYDYVCANVSYDEEHLGDDTYLLQYTPYAALVNKTSVCQGYALLMYRLLLELGVNCRVISGNGAGEAHAWNIVELDGLWYNLDATWDAGAAEYSWFLKSTWNFPSHDRYLDYETLEFHWAHPMAAEDYAEGTVGEMDSIIYVGQCGNTAYWLLDRYGDLHISGEGATWDFGDDVETMPDWKYWTDDIVTVIVEEGITYIGDHSFSGMSFVTDVALPEGLEEIGDYAFESCKGLTSVELPTDVTAIGSYAFSNCTALTGIVIPDGVTVIEQYTFYNCKSMAGVELPANLTSIGNYAFYSCSGLESMVFPDGLTTVCEMAFSSAGLKTVEIPPSVTAIESGAFENCTSLAAIHFRGDPPEFADDIFSGVTATAYYPADNTAWTADMMQDYGGSITWSHEHVYESAVTAPTCIEGGYATYTCTVCGESYVDDYVDAAGHSYESAVTDPTCTEQGYTTHTCTVCGHSYADSYVGVIDHACGEYRLTLVPTRFKTGRLTAVCGVCGGDVTVTLPALNGKNYTIEVTLEPTETETGTAVYTWNNTEYGAFSFEVTLRSLGDKIPLGDVNGDGFINLLDANLVASFYSGRFELTENELLAADVNGDGTVNILDARLIADYYNEVIETFPTA